MTNFSKRIVLAGCVLGLMCGTISAQDPAGGPRVLGLDEFIQQATQNDTEFESILVDELVLKYQKDLGLPARDLVLSVKGQYDLILDPRREEPEVSVALSKLFPYSGTDFSAAYKSTPSLTKTDSSSEFSLTISQPIAQNAFGKGTRLLDKIIGLEVDVARHQIIEAYEDYLASIVVAYYDWFGAFENLKIAESSYEENVKLLDNIRDRQDSHIALPIDVNKITLQVMAKKEKLVELREQYRGALNLVLKAVRYSGTDELIPSRPEKYAGVQPDVDQDQEWFRANSRTAAVLHLLETKSSLEVDKNANDLLPSIDLLFGYKVSGEDLGVTSEDNLAFAGVAVEWPFPDQVERAEYEVSRVGFEKARLSRLNTRARLNTLIRNLSLQIEREKELKAIALEKMSLAQKILEAETVNYSYGKVSLNDYIDAVNVLDNNRFNEVAREVQYQTLIIEWLRLTDSLVRESDVPFKRGK